MAETTGLLQADIIKTDAQIIHYGSREEKKEENQQFDPIDISKVIDNNKLQTHSISSLPQYQNALQLLKTYKNYANHAKDRYIFIKIKVLNLYNVNDEGGIFNIRFKMNLRWSALREEHDEYIKTKEKSKWRPLYVPEITFVNDRSVTTKWNNFKLFEEGKDNLYFINGQVLINGIFEEDYEMKNYPFDCQDLTVRIRDESGNQFRYIPEFIDDQFCEVAHCCMELDEFDLQTATMDIRENEIILAMKLQRRWFNTLMGHPMTVFLLNILSLAMFSLDVGDYWRRFSFLLSLILTSVASKIKQKDKPYFTWLAKYMMVSFLYLIITVIMVAISINNENVRNNDDIVFIIWIILLSLIQIIFIMISFIKKKEEEDKLYCHYDHLQKKISQNYAQSRLEFDYKTSFGIRSVSDRQLISYYAHRCEFGITNEMDNKLVQRQNKRFDKLWEQYAKWETKAKHETVQYQYTKKFKS